MSRLLTAGISGTLLALSVLASAAPKGGKGGGNGGGDEPQYMPAFVNYRVTWIDIPTEMGTEGELYDINRDGYAVGAVRTADGAYRGLLADKDGGCSALNDVFAEDLDALPGGWRFHVATDINAAGNVAGVLVPDDQLRVCSSPDVLIVNANLYSQPPSFTGGSVFE
ncbi:MAG: hypothetical protein R3F19_29840 [Verrucomicrobiales bacterium]